MNSRRYLMVALGAAFCIGCSDSPTSPAVSPPIDRLFIYARNWPSEEAEIALIREAGKSTLTLFIPARVEHPRIVLDSIGPSPEEPEKVRVMLESFDIWAMNAPNAPGAACRTVDGQRICNPTFEDYSLVMQVESGGKVRVQRYTHLELITAVPSARALADYVLAWARELEGSAQAHRQPSPQPGSATQAANAPTRRAQRAINSAYACCNVR